MSLSFSSQSPLDLPLDEHGEPLVQPEVLKVVVGDEVAGPRVRDLVGDDVGERLVPGEEGGRGEGQAGVLHA